MRAGRVPEHRRPAAGGLGYPVGVDGVLRERRRVAPPAVRVGRPASEGASSKTTSSWSSVIKAANLAVSPRLTQSMKLTTAATGGAGFLAIPAVPLP